MEYKIIYSSRKTLALTVKDGELIVRAPYKTSKIRIEKMISEHQEWVENAILKSHKQFDKFAGLSDAEIARHKKNAKEYFASKIRYFAEIMNLKYGRITITSAKTRFGSCSASGNIAFSWHLMLYPEAAREYVIVHELAHLVHMNHSPEFYSLIEKYLPDYKERKKLLKI